MIATEKYVKVVSKPGSEPKAVSESVNILNQDITVTENGVYRAAEGYTGLGTVTVNVPTEASGSVTYTENGTYNISQYAQVVINVPNSTSSLTVTENGTYTPQSPNIGFNSVTVNVPLPSGSVTYTQNGTYDITDYSSVTIAVPNGTETINITENGTYTPSGSNIGFSSVTVNVSGEKTFGLTKDQLFGTLVNGVPTYPVSTPAPNFTGIKTIPERYLDYLFYNRSDLTGTVVWDPEVIFGQYSCVRCFSLCTGITGTGLEIVTSLTNTYCLSNCFRGCSGLTSTGLSNLETISDTGALEYAFCESGVSDIEMDNLTTITANNALYYCFSGCPNITTAVFTKLSVLTGGYVFSNCFNCPNIQTISFPALTSNSFGSNTTQFNSMLGYLVDGCTVHFPSNLQSVIGSWSSVTSGFGGTNTVVLFDLPATES